MVTVVANYRHNHPKSETSDNGGNHDKFTLSSLKPDCLKIRPVDVVGIADFILFTLFSKYEFSRYRLYHFKLLCWAVQ
jgi:hypothetical protein